jgi:hypothetical protein
MIQALLDGSKTQTRRVVKLRELAGDYFEGGAAGVEFDGFRIPRNSGPAPAQLSAEAVGGGAFLSEELYCPYGQPGERIWARETFYAYGHWETRFSAKKKRDEWHFIDMTIECDRRYQYAADNPGLPLTTGRGGALPGWHKRPAIFMPRAACRILLDITAVRVERLNDCSESDALAEGISTVRNAEWDAAHFPEWKREFDAVCARGNKPPIGPMPSQTYAALWESINGAGSWAANPWVWCVEFSRVLP